ncbi:interferon alpha-2 [Columba livia]|nr:interferon alpha-2 [Columba livia]
MACRLHNRALPLSSPRFTHSQVAQGMSQQEPACCRASSQEDESLVLIVSGSLALALVSLQRYLSTCVSTVNSLALLREQAQEVQQLKKDLTRLTAEMSSLKTEIEDLRMAMSAMPVEESVQMSAWALKSTGVTIDLQRSQRSFTWPCRLFWFLCDLRPQETFVQGLDEEGKEETLLGTFSYDIKKAPAQTFPLQSELPRAFQRIRLLIQSNWGKSRYTCIYRVQVHGKPSTPPYTALDAWLQANRPQTARISDLCSTGIDMNYCSATHIGEEKSILSKYLTCSHQRKAIENSLQLLDKMGEKFPQRCLREKMSFKFPKQVLKPTQKEAVEVAIEEIFQHIFYIFSKNLTLAAWDGTALEKFQNGLYHQIEQLEACVIKKQTHYFRSKEVNRLKLKKYFQKIDCFLKDKQHNLCSWEISRAEMRRCLQLIDKVIRKLYN